MLCVDIGFVVMLGDGCVYFVDVGCLIYFNFWFCVDDLGFLR